MLGPEGIARGVVAGLAARMPGAMAEIRERLGLSLYELPDLTGIYPTEITIRAVNDFPVASVVEFDTSGKVGNRQFDMDSTFDEYSYRYRMRVFLWCMSDNHEATDLQRKRLALAARVALLQDKIVCPESNGNSAQLDPHSLKESFSDIGEKEALQLIGGVYLEFEVVSQERLGAWPTPPVTPAVITHDEVIVAPADTHHYPPIQIIKN